MKKDKKGKTPVMDAFKLGATVAALGIALGVNMDAAYGGIQISEKDGKSVQGDATMSTQDKDKTNLNTGSFGFNSRQDKWKAGQTKLNASQDKWKAGGQNNLGISQQKKGAVPAVQSKSIIIEGSSTQIKGESN